MNNFKPAMTIFHCINAVDADVSSSTSTDIDDTEEADLEDESAPAESSIEDESEATSAEVAPAEKPEADAQYDDSARQDMDSLVKENQ